MPEFAFTSSLALEHRDEVERLMFFNDNQAKVIGGVEVVTEKYGMPRLRVIADRLRVVLEPHAPQTLFAVVHDGEVIHPVGAAVYVREAGALVVLFLAVHEAYTSRGEHGQLGLLRRLIGELEGIGRRVRGIDTLAVYFGRPTPTRLAIKRNRD